MNEKEHGHDALSKRPPLVLHESSGQEATITARSKLARCPGRLVGVAVDDTRLRKTDRLIRQAFYQRDPLSPPFHVNLMLGLRFLQASIAGGPVPAGSSQHPGCAHCL
ncbi:MAG: hypothetical protein AB1898_11185 [Acidobacteriota bacterium]